MKKIFLSLPFCLLGLLPIQGQSSDSIKIQVKHLLDIIYAEETFKNLLSEHLAELGEGEFTQAVLEEITSRYQEIEDTLISLYTIHFTKDEIMASLEFYSSDIGRSIIKKSQIVEWEIMKFMEVWSENIAEKTYLKLDSINRELFLSPTNSCHDFIEGTFDVVLNNQSQYRIHRDMDSQVEIFEEDNYYYTLEWLSDCQYRITSILAEGENPENIEISVGTIYHHSGDEYHFVEKSLTYEYFIKGVAKKILDD